MSGYVFVSQSGHPRAHKGFVLEHVLVAEKVLGKSLPKKAVVHHINICRSDNRNENLVVCQDNNYHQLLHKRLRAYKAVGDPSALRCGLCGGYENQGDMHIDRKGYGKHKACINARARRLVRARLGLSESSEIPQRAIILICVECGSEFKSYPSTKRLFCSQRCKNQYQTGKPRNHSLKHEEGRDGRASTI